MLTVIDTDSVKENGYTRFRVQLANGLAALTNLPKQTVNSANNNEY